MSNSTPDRVSAASSRPARAGDASRRIAEANQSIDFLGYFQRRRGPKAPSAIGRDRGDPLGRACRKGKREVAARPETQDADPRIVHPALVGQMVQTGPCGLPAIVRGQPRQVRREHEIIVGG